MQVTFPLLGTTWVLPWLGKEAHIQHCQQGKDLPPCKMFCCESGLCPIYQITSYSIKNKMPRTKMGFANGPKSLMCLLLSKDQLPQQTQPNPCTYLYMRPVSLATRTQTPGNWRERGMSTAASNADRIEHIPLSIHVSAPHQASIVSQAHDQSFIRRRRGKTQL